MAEMPKRPSDDSARARMDRYARDQQGLRDWTNDAIRSHAAAIGLALEFDDRCADDSHRADEKADRLPSEKVLRTELQLAGKKFDRSPAAMWRVLKKYYRASDAHLDALAERFVSGYEADLREANERRRLGQTDDDDEPDPNTETQPFKTLAKEATEEMVKDTGRCETEVVERLRQAIRNHPNIGAVSADPPGAQDGMRPYGRWRVTKYGVFAPGGLWGWERISKTPLDPLAHSSAYLTDLDPRVHLIRTTYDGLRKIEREIEIPRTTISAKSPNAAIKALTHHNVYVVRNDFARAEMVNFLNWRPTKRKIIRTKTTGWLKTDGGYCFVLPLVPPELAPIMPTANGSLVEKRSRARAQPEIIARLDEPIGDAGRKYGFDVSGTVKEWQDRIARPLEGCSNVALAAGVAFAAPVFFFAGEQSGGFHIWCDSTFGKSTASAVGESIYGRPSTTHGNVEWFGTKWASASDVGIVGLAQKRTDVGLFLDELGSAKSIKEKLVETIYVLTGGTPKLRADSQGKIREQQGFRTMVFSTGEIPLRKFLDKMDDTEGRKKRLVDVPALVGSETALETVPHEKLGEVCGIIYTATADLHGAVGLEWLHYLVDLGEAGINAKLAQYRQAWLALPEIAELLNRDPKDDSVIRRFALHAAALRMAIEAGLWPWSIASSDRAIAACTLRWAADKGLPVTTVEEKAAEQKFRQAIEAERAKFVILEKHPGRGGGLFVPIPEHAIIYENPAAFRKAGTLYGFIKIDGENTRILVPPDAFGRLTAACGIEHDALVDYLQRKGSLEIKNEKVRNKTERYFVLGNGFLREETDPAQPHNR
jgi:hypothetical protein